MRDAPKSFDNNAPCSEPSCKSLMFNCISNQPVKTKQSFLVKKPFHPF